MKKLLICLLIVAPSICIAQDEQGIKFENDLKNWNAVLLKAKAENKYIFIDCYTTWCGPCKIMDKQVYTAKEVGDYFNSKFLSIKIQMDRTDKDDKYTKNWYGDAEFVLKNFTVSAFPTFLFLAPGGKPLHKATGLLNPQQFVALAKDAENPDKQYYKMLAEFKPGVMDTSEMKGIARALKYSGSELAQKIVTDYLNRVPGSALFSEDNLKLVKEFKETAKAQEVALKYIKSLSAEKLFAKDNIEFLKEFSQTSKSASFKIVYANQEKINKVMKDNDYSQNIIASIIFKEDFFNAIGLPARDKVKKGDDVKEPDWRNIDLIIVKKYNQYYSNRVIMDAKIWWYSLTKNWNAYSKAHIKKIDAVYSKKDLSDGGVCWNLNNDCWSVFERATDTTVLKRAIYWMEESFRHSLIGATFSTYMDTYANLHYKLGNKEIALVWQDRAAKLDRSDQAIADNLKKMKNNEPTWPITSNSNKTISKN